MPREDTRGVTAAHHAPFPAPLSRVPRHGLLAPLSLHQSSSSTGLLTQHSTAWPSQPLDKPHSPGVVIKPKPREMASILISSTSGIQEPCQDRFRAHQGLLQPHAGR